MKHRSAWEISAILLVAVGSVTEPRADLILIAPGGAGSPPGRALRHSETTGGFVSVFTHGAGRFDEEMEGAAYGPDGHLYVAVRDLTLGQILQYHGTTGHYLKEFVPMGAGGEIVPWGLTKPYALKFGPTGDLYAGGISDPEDLSPGKGRIFRYNGRTGAFVGLFVTDGAGGLSCPFDMVFGPDGDLFVADGRFCSTEGGLGVLRYDGVSGEFKGTFVARGSGGLTNASGLVFGREGNLYVSSFSTDNVLRYNGTTGEFIDEFVSSSSGDLDGPTGLCFGHDGRLYVCSAEQHAVIRFDGDTGAFVDMVVPPNAGLETGPNYILLTGPTLRISRAAPSTLMVAWQAAQTNYALEASSDLGASWVRVPTAPTVSGNEFSLLYPIVGRSEVFRLVDPQVRNGGAQVGLVQPPKRRDVGALHPAATTLVGRSVAWPDHNRRNSQHRHFVAPPDEDGASAAHVASCERAP